MNIPRSADPNSTLHSRLSSFAFPHPCSSNFQFHVDCVQNHQRSRNNEKARLEGTFASDESKSVRNSQAHAEQVHQGITSNCQQLQHQHSRSSVSGRRISSPRARQRSSSSSSHNAARERCRVRALRAAFADLQHCLPAVPEDTKLSKLDVLVLATTYIAHLTSTLSTAAGTEIKSSANVSSQTTCNENVQGNNTKAVNKKKLTSTEMVADYSPFNKNTVAVSAFCSQGYFHPVKKWPMRTYLYAGIVSSIEKLNNSTTN